MNHFLYIYVRFLNWLPEDAGPQQGSTTLTQRQEVPQASHHAPLAPSSARWASSRVDSETKRHKKTQETHTPQQWQNVNAGKSQLLAPHSPSVQRATPHFLTTEAARWAGLVLWLWLPLWSRLRTQWGGEVSKPAFIFFSSSSIFFLNFFYWAW